MSFAADHEDYGSTFGDTAEAAEKDAQDRQQRRDAIAKRASGAKASYSVFSEEASRDEGRRQRHKYLALNAYDRHKMLVNEYVLTSPGSAAKYLTRDTSSDRTDYDVVKENHRFLWDAAGKDEEQSLTWGQRLAKRYFEKLFHEYCICDLSRYRENKIAMRWQTESEVRAGKGQFRCGSRRCEEVERLRTWEVNFAYLERGEKKNALVKVRLCPDCSCRLNYHHKRKELKKKPRKVKSKGEKAKREGKRSSRDASESEKEKRQSRTKSEVRTEKATDNLASDIWSAPLNIEKERTREEDFSEYFEDLFL